MISRLARRDVSSVAVGRADDNGSRRRERPAMAHGGDRRSSRIGALLLAVSCLGAACGSRESGPPPAGAQGSVAAGPTTPASPVVGDNGKVGTLSAACGSGHPAHGATERGVTDTTITIGVISDKSGVVAVPTAGIDGSVDAFVQFCNSPRWDQRSPARTQALRLEDPQRGRRDATGVRRRHLRARRLGLRAGRSRRADHGAVQAGRGRGVHRHLRQRVVAPGVLTCSQSRHLVCGRPRPVHRPSASRPP